MLQGIASFTKAMTASVLVELKSLLTGVLGVITAIQSLRVLEMAGKQQKGDKT